MDSRPLDRLTSRAASAALMVYVVGAGLVGLLVPQQASVARDSFSAWQASNPTLARVAAALQLDHVFTSWWFGTGLALFMLSLSVATWRMCRVSWYRWRGPSRAPRTAINGVSAGEIAARALQAGYREVATGAGVRRFVRHRIGWWGPALMHLGMVISVAAALASSAFGARAVVDFSAGEVRGPGDPYLYSESGPLGAPVEFGYPIRFDYATYGYWPNGEVRTIKANLSVLEESGVWRPLTFSVNHPLEIDSYVVYVNVAEIGEAAFVELSGEGMPDAAMRIDFPLTALDQSSYSDVRPEGWPTVEARWDPTLQRDNRRLALRVVDGDDVHQVALEPGERGQFGPYEADLVFMGQWARLIIVRPVAVEVLFFGFGIIALSSLIVYGLVPRELVIAEDVSGVRYGWRAARMPRAFDEERQGVIFGDRGA